MTTIEWVKKRRKNRRTGRMQTVWDLRIWAGSRKFSTTFQGYADRRRARAIWERIKEDIKAGRTRIKATVAILLLATVPAAAVNSPRPASFRAEGGHLVVTWTNLNTAHPWLLSYADAPGAWRWETNRLSSTDGRLVVSRPMTEPVRFYRLWPAAP